MAAVLVNAKRLSIAEAAKRIGRLTGRTPSDSTIWRWCSRGVRGHRIPFRRCGTRILIAVADLESFISATNQT